MASQWLLGGWVVIEPSSLIAGLSLVWIAWWVMWSTVRVLMLRLRVASAWRDVVWAAAMSWTVVCTYGVTGISISKLTVHIEDNLLDEVWMVCFKVATCCLAASSCFFKPSLSCSTFSTYLKEYGCVYVRGERGCWGVKVEDVEWGTLTQQGLCTCGNKSEHAHWTLEWVCYCLEILLLATVKQPSRGQWINQHHVHSIQISLTSRASSKYFLYPQHSPLANSEARF